MDGTSRFQENIKFRGFALDTFLKIIALKNIRLQTVPIFPPHEHMYAFQKVVKAFFADNITLQNASTTCVHYDQIGHKTAQNTVLSTFRGIIFFRENHSPILFSPILYAISMYLGENIPQNILLVHLEDKISLNVLLLMSTFRGIFPLNVIFV